MAETCRNPAIAPIIGGASTGIAGTGRGAWISASLPDKTVYVRPIDRDLVLIVDANKLEEKEALDFILRMGSLTFEHGR